MKLNIGGQQTLGRFPEGWTCVDILDGADIKCDISETPLPFKNNSVSAIYCSHVLEHIWPWKLSFVLGEFHRVLMSDHPIRIVVPDMSFAIRQYLESENPRAIEKCMGWWFDPSLDRDGNLCMNHVGGFTSPSLFSHLQGSKHLLLGPMFRDIRKKQYTHCNQAFTGCDNPGHEETSLYMEAIK